MCVRAFTETLYDHFVNLIILGQNGTLTPKTKELLRQMIDGIEELRVNNVYHGNLDLRTTFYDRPNNLVKLANFKEKGGNEVIQSQYEDWHGVGRVASQLSVLARSHSLFPLVDCTLIDEFAALMAQLEPTFLPLNKVKSWVFDQVFFWDENRRSSFFTYDILKAFGHLGFIEMVEELHYIPVEWNLNKDYDGFLRAMNAYRKENGEGEYQGGRYTYVRFVSAAYTHENEMKDKHEIEKNVTADSVFTEATLRLCFDLVNIMKNLGLF